MSGFPHERAKDAAAFQQAYFAELDRAARTVAPDAVAQAAAMLQQALDADLQVFLAGNGGSAAIANHLVADYAKGLRYDTNWKPRVRSLSSSQELLTAIGNDLGYEHTFAFQLEGLARAGDVLVSVSSSGNSENIVRAVQWARDNAMKSIALTGFEGGRSARLADVNIHVASDNYGVVEDVHQSVLHLLGQWLRMSQMPESLIPQRKF